MKQKIFYRNKNIWENKDSGGWQVDQHGSCLMTPRVWNPSVYLHSVVGWWPLGRLRPGSVVEGIQGVCVGYWIVGTGCLMFILCGWYTVRVSWSHHGVCLVMDLNVNLVWQHRYPPPQHSPQPHPTLFFLLCYLNTDNINKTSLCSLLWRFLSTIELVDMRKGFYKVDNTIVGRYSINLFWISEHGIIGMLKMCIIYFQVRTFVLQCPQLGGESPLPIMSHVSLEPDTGTKPRPPPADYAAWVSSGHTRLPPSTPWLESLRWAALTCIMLPLLQRQTNINPCSWHPDRSGDGERHRP